MEFVLHGLAEFSQLSRHRIEKGIEFKDLMSGMFSMKNEEGEGEGDEEDGGPFGFRDN
jgi:magnesium chelatase subunit I